MDSIRATHFASYNICPFKAKLQQEMRIDNQNFDIGNVIHHVLAEAPIYILEDKDWGDLFVAEIGKINTCSPEIIRRTKEAITRGFTSVKRAIDEGLMVTTEVPLSRMLPCGITVTGTADRIDEGKKLFRIVDYKSGFVVPTKQDMLGDMQLLTYAYLSQDISSVSQKIEIALYSLGRDFMQILEVPGEIECVIEDVLNERAIKMANDTEYKPYPSSLCGYCDYAYKCHFWQQFKQDLQIPETIEDTVSLLEELMSVEKGLSGIIDTMKDKVVSHMVEQELEEVSINGSDSRIIQTIRKSSEGKFSISKPYIKVAGVSNE